MDYTSTLLGIAGIFALGVTSPGPNFVVVTSTAIAASRRAGLFTALGIACGGATWTILAILGLSLILTQAVWLYTALKIVGAVYLLYIGVKMIRYAREPAPLPGSALAPRDTQPLLLLRRGYLTSLTNPKTAAFFSSLFVVVLPPDAPLWVYAATVGIIIVMSAGWYGALALFFSTGPVQTAYRKAKTALDCAMGALLIGLGVRLLVTR